MALLDMAGAAAHCPTARTMKETGTAASMQQHVGDMRRRHMDSMQGAGMLRDRDGSVYEGMFINGKVSPSFSSIPYCPTADDLALMCFRNAGGAAPCDPAATSTSASTRAA
jgi:hypothetical protein